MVIVMAEGLKLRVLIIDYPYPKKVRESYKFTSNFIKILQSVADKVYVISDNIDARILDKTHLKRIGVSPHFLANIRPKWLSILIWGLKSIVIQTKICIEILKVTKNVDIIIFFMMFPYTEVIPMLFAKLVRKKIIRVPLGVAPKDKVYTPRIYSFFERMSSYLADYYIPEYESTVEKLKNYGQLRYPEKLLPAAHFFLLEDNFKITKSIYEKENIVGYIGGFREIKGVLNFVNAIPLVIEKNKNIRFLIAGEGILRRKIEKKVNNLPKDKVILMDWLPHEELPKYLNKLKLLVIPSYSETGPFIAIEAMACGTPILATKVGVIPLLVKDGETGFILDDNSPECIAKNILRVLDYNEHYLQDIANKAGELVNKKYTFFATSSKWKEVLNKINR